MRYVFAFCSCGYFVKICFHYRCRKFNSIILHSTTLFLNFAFAQLRTKALRRHRTVTPKNGKTQRFTIFYTASHSLKTLVLLTTQTCGTVFALVRQALRLPNQCFTHLCLQLRLPSEVSLRLTCFRFSCYFCVLVGFQYLEAIFFIFVPYRNF